PGRRAISRRSHTTHPAQPPPGRATGVRPSGTPRWTGRSHPSRPWLAGVVRDISRWATSATFARRGPPPSWLSTVLALAAVHTGGSGPQLTVPLQVGGEPAPTRGHSLGRG